MQNIAQSKLKGHATHTMSYIATFLYECLVWGLAIIIRFFPILLCSCQQCFNASLTLRGAKESLFFSTKSLTAALLVQAY